MSIRARHARRLASLLQHDTGVAWVRVVYYRERRGYAVHWEGGPEAARMYELAALHADEIPELDIRSLVWLRTEPQNRLTG